MPRLPCKGREPPAVSVGPRAGPSPQLLLPSVAQIVIAPESVVRWLLSPTVLCAVFVAVRSRCWSVLAPESCCWEEFCCSLQARCLLAVCFSSRLACSVCCCRWLLCSAERRARRVVVSKIARFNGVRLPKLDIAAELDEWEGPTHIASYNEFCNGEHRYTCQEGANRLGRCHLLSLPGQHDHDDSKIAGRTCPTAQKGGRHQPRHGSDLPLLVTSVTFCDSRHFFGLVHFRMLSNSLSPLPIHYIACSLYPTFPLPQAMTSAGVPSTSQAGLGWVGLADSYPAALWRLVPSRSLPTRVADHFQNANIGSKQRPAGHQTPWLQLRKPSLREPHRQIQIG